jgi:enoyl-CoA hydratase
MEESTMAPSTPMADSSTAPSAYVDVDDGILVMTINRPYARNAIDGSAARIIADAMVRLDADDSLRLGILTGADRSFSAGMDLKAFLEGQEISLDGRGMAGFCEVPPAKPLIAAVEGWALAGGFEMALTCDMMVAADDAKFGLPEPRRGLVAGAGGLLRLPRCVPRNIATEIALTGATFDAVQAHSWGLVNHLTPPGGALDRALTLGRAIVANGPLAVTATMRVLADSARWSDEDAFARQWEIIGPVFDSEDAREGALAFTEKRPPVWRGQ